MPLCSNVESTMLRLLLNNSTGSVPPLPTTLYLGVSTTAPGSDGSNVTEPSGSGYARLSIASSTTNWTAATNANPSTCSNAIAMSLGPATGSWGTASYFVLFTTLTGTTSVGVAAFGAMNTPQAIVSGQTLTFAIGSIVFSMTGPSSGT